MGTVRWVQLAEAARLVLRQDACQGPPTASLDRGAAPSPLRETRRALRPPSASAAPLAATCCKTPRRRCRMPRLTQRLDAAGDVELSLCAYSRTVNAVSSGLPVCNSAVPAELPAPRGRRRRPRGGEARERDARGEGPSAASYDAEDDRSQGRLIQGGRGPCRCRLGRASAFAIVGSCRGPSQKGSSAVALAS